MKKQDWPNFASSVKWSGKNTDLGREPSDSAIFDPQSCPLPQNVPPIRYVAWLVQDVLEEFLGHTIFLNRTNREDIWSPQIETEIIIH